MGVTHGVVKEVLPGFEVWLPDEESGVLTVTPQNMLSLRHVNFQTVVRMGPLSECTVTEPSPHPEQKYLHPSHEVTISTEDQARTLSRVKITS